MKTVSNINQEKYPIIIIDRDMKEEFKELMEWNEDQFKKNTRYILIAKSHEKKAIKKTIKDILKGK